MFRRTHGKKRVKVYGRFKVKPEILCGLCQVSEEKHSGQVFNVTLQNVDLTPQPMGRQKRYF